MAGRNRKQKVGLAYDEAFAEFGKYVSGVSDGTIVSGQFAKLAVARHLADLDRQGDSDFGFVFDELAAYTAITAFPAVFVLTMDRWAGRPFVLTPSHAFIVGNLFGWKCKAKVDGRVIRRFRKAFVSFGRKQAKSTLAAAISVLLAGFDDVQAAQVYHTATKIEQARVVFEEAQRQCTMSPVLRMMTDVKRSRIEFPGCNGLIRPLGSDRPFSGLNPNGVVIDELHEFKEKHRPFLQTMVTGFGSRLEPLELYITTAGTPASFIWKEEEGYAKQVLQNTLQNERYFAYVAAMDEDDDILDEKNWPKSMPNLGITVTYDTIRDLAREAATREQKRIEFKRFYANLEVTNTATAVDVKDWDACAVDELSEWNHADALACAIDAGGISDLFAVAFAAKFAEGENEEGKAEYRYEVRCQSYIDAGTDRDLYEEPFASWIANGDLLVVPNLYSAVRQSVADEMWRIGCRTIGFDPFNMQQMGEEFLAEGFDAKKISQNRFQYHEPLSLFIDLVKRKRISHDRTDPVLRWAIGNLVINSNQNNQWMPDRKNSRDKIDPAVATLMALKLASLQQSRPKGSLFVT